MSIHEIILHLPEPPSVNHYWRRVGNRTVLSSDGRKFKLAVKAQALRELGGRWPLIPKGPISVTMTWYRSRKSGDLDNRTKAALDALNGIAYTDDNQIVAMHLYREECPRAGYCVVRVATVSSAP